MKLLNLNCISPLYLPIDKALELEIKSRLERFKNTLWETHFKINKNDAIPFIQGKDRRIVCIVNKTLTMHCALMPYPEGWYIMMNKANIKKLSLTEGDLVHLSIRKDDSKYGMPIPEELRSCLDEDPLSMKYFEGLTSGKKRNLIYIVSKIKSSEIRINRSLAILEHLVRERGSLDFKKLNELIKEYNQRYKL